MQASVTRTADVYKHGVGTRTYVHANQYHRTSTYKTDSWYVE